MTQTKTITGQAPNKRVANHPAQSPEKKSKGRAWSLLLKHIPCPGWGWPLGRGLVDLPGFTSIQIQVTPALLPLLLAAWCVQNLPGGEGCFPQAAGSAALEIAVK